MKTDPSVFPFSPEPLWVQIRHRDRSYRGRYLHDPALGPCIRVERRTLFWWSFFCQRELGYTPGVSRPTAGRVHAAVADELTTRRNS